MEPGTTTTMPATTVMPEFGVHILNEQGITTAKLMAWKFTELTTWLEATAGCMPGREWSITKTKLEEACFFAKKAMATNLINQQTEQ